MKRAQVIITLSPLAIEKQDVRWFLKPDRLGDLRRPDLHDGFLNYLREIVAKG